MSTMTDEGVSEAVLVEQAPDNPRYAETCGVPYSEPSTDDLFDDVKYEGHQPVSARRKCPRCPHDKDQHSFNGCTWSEMRGGTWWECPCKVKYNEI